LLEDAERILVSPDGPLHLLPFSALVRKLPPRPEYFVEWKPLHNVISATVYRELLEARGRAPAGGTVAVFGDPGTALPENVIAGRDAGRSETLREGSYYDLAPLPKSREEVDAIASLYGSDARPFLGERVTESQILAVSRSARILHFAGHGVLDESSPLNSSLVLSPGDRSAPGRDNGLLQAWEIFERVQLDADLVTLSACQTALGRDSGGEGLLSLARAFQFAGARSVLASLWSVSDGSTTELMKRFYSEMKAGKSKAESLRTAQLDLIQGGAHGPTPATPFHWAAFELFGDWK
jgi:CHAT domain-containing protein